MLFFKAIVDSRCNGDVSNGPDLAPSPFSSSNGLT